MFIRRARAEDVLQIVGLYVADPVTGPREATGEVLPPVYAEAFREIEANANQCLLVAEESGVLTGTVQVTLIPHVMAQGLRRAVVEAMFVHPDYQGRGIGRALMEAAIAQGREWKCGAVELTSNKVRKEAHAFYGKLGFVATHEGFKLALPRE
ncbi:GNAT family N-acetyltransferase [soil metagenome]